jgi:NAD-dependent dihydropyrimidine dehydrogenase PreA subunit
MIDRNRCTGCGRCVAACPLRLFTLDTFGQRKTAVLTAPEQCTGCMQCTVECPVGALSDSRA